MWVIKLGGSLLGSPELNGWLEVIARHGDGKIVIVPGGGILADAVREAQMMCGVKDEVAHKMAVMSMDQYGMLLAGLNPELVTASSELEIAERGWQHRAIVWLPSSMVIAEERMPTNWQMTSDSIAAWLANRLNAEHLILVKSQRPGMDQISLERLTKDGYVDDHFGDYIVGQNFNTWILGKQDYSAFNQALSQEQLFNTGLPVRCSWN